MYIIFNLTDSFNLISRIYATQVGTLAEKVEKLVSSLKTVKS